MEIRPCFCIPGLRILWRETRVSDLSFVFITEVAWLNLKDKAISGFELQHYRSTVLSFVHSCTTFPRITVTMISRDSRNRVSCVEDWRNGNEYKTFGQITRSS